VWYYRREGWHRCSSEWTSPSYFDLILPPSHQDLRKFPLLHFDHLDGGGPKPFTGDTLLSMCRRSLRGTRPRLKVD